MAFIFPQGKWTIKRSLRQMTKSGHLSFQKSTKGKFDEAVEIHSTIAELTVFHTFHTSLSATELTRALFELQKLLLKERYDYNVGTSTFIATELPLPNFPSFYTLNNDIFHGKKK